MAEDNIYWLPRVCGPDLRRFYDDLLKQPLPERHTKLLAEMAAAEAKGLAAACAGREAAAPPQEREPEPSE